MTTQEMKNNIANKFDEVSFRKFGNAFRKHIDSFFKQEYNEESLNGMNWSELASYIIMDGNYTVTEEQYKNFMKCF
jgi:predicted lipoprotein